MLLAVVVAALLVVTNSRESQTVSQPYYAPLLGAARHPPPYALKEMAIDVHYDRGWPIWHTRRSESFAAHNAALYLSDDGPQLATPMATDDDFDIVFDDGTEFSYLPPSATDWVRAGFDAAIGLLLIAIAVALFELSFRRVRVARERLEIIDPTSIAA